MNQGLANILDFVHHGHLDPPRLWELIGWAWDPSRPGARLRVDLAVDGQPLRRVTASGFRPDLLDAGIGDGRHAFSLELPRRVFDGLEHTLSATVIEGEHLGASPMRFQSRYAGDIREVTAATVRGFLRDDARPDLPAGALVAEVHADGRFLGWARTVSADGEFEIRTVDGFDVTRVAYFELFAKGCSQPIARFGKQPLLRNPFRRWFTGAPEPAAREIRIKNYSWVCPRGDYIDETGHYCGEPSNIAACERCFRMLGPRPGWGGLLHRYGSVAELRADSRRILGKAAVVELPSREALERIARYIPEVRTKARVADPETSLEKLAPIVLPGRPERPVARPVWTVCPAGRPPETVTVAARAGKCEVKAPADPTVDIIVPVYRGVEETLQSLRSVLASRNPATPFELIAILDNPGDADMQRALEAQQASTPFTLLRNERNLGFVRTVNRGMALHPDRDVLLLNSDTEVSSDDWLDRLRAAAYAEPHTGTATPFSNNATICSYPRFSRDNPLPAGHTVETLDALCRRLLAGRTVEIPVAVGFCMYIRRDCLAQTGEFDAETFGLGYGEENDFCMRAARFGWTHVLAAAVFVRHLGGLSFQGNTSKLIRENSEKLNAKHPEYPALVDSFLRRDPIRPLRRELDWARLEPPGCPIHCFATNTLPGGTERHVQQRAAEFRRAHPDGKVAILRYSSTNVSLEIDGVDPPGYPNLAFDLPAEREALRQMLVDRLGVERIHIHQIVDAPLSIFQLGIPYDITVHDYGWICPQVTLQAGNWRYCGEPADIADCEWCYSKLGPHKDWGSLVDRSSSVAEMRRQNAELLEHAGTVWFPSADGRDRILRYAPGISNAVADPPQALRAKPVRRWRRTNSRERVRAAYLGSLGYAKGFHVLYGLALDALKRDLPLDFHIIGGTANSEPLLDLGVRIHGPYEEDEAGELLAAVEPHLALFPGHLPESFSYTLTVAFEQGVWPVAYDLGAIAERIREAGFGSLMPLDATEAEINDLLLREATPSPAG